MFTLLTVLILATAASAVPLVGDDDPIVDLMKEVIYELDQYMAQNHMDVLKMPDLGVLPWDPVKLRDGRLGNFSSLELRGTPDMQEQDNPDGSTTITFDLLLGLDRADISYDFILSALIFLTQNGTASIETHHNSARVKGVMVTGGASGCAVALSSVEVLEFGDFTITVSPDDLPLITEINEALLDYITPKLLPTLNKVIKKVVETELFEDIISKILCKHIPI